MAEPPPVVDPRAEFARPAETSASGMLDRSTETGQWQVVRVDPLPEAAPAHAHRPTTMQPAVVQPAFTQAPTMQPAANQAPAARSILVEERPAEQRYVDQRPFEAPTQSFVVEQAPRQVRSTRDQDRAQAVASAWYRSEDPTITAEHDAAFDKFMNGDNPHLRTDEVPVVDFTQVIERVELEKAQKRGGSGFVPKFAMAVIATLAALGFAQFSGLVTLPGLGGSAGGNVAIPADAPDSSGDSTTDSTVVAEATQPEGAPEVLSNEGDGVSPQAPAQNTDG